MIPTHQNIGLQRNYDHFLAPSYWPRATQSRRSCSSALRSLFSVTVSQFRGSFQSLAYLRLRSFAQMQIAKAQPNLKLTCKQRGVARLTHACGYLKHDDYGGKKIHHSVIDSAIERSIITSKLLVTTHTPRKPTNIDNLACDGERQ